MKVGLVHPVDQKVSEDGEVVSAGINELGQEVPDGTPMALPVGMSHHDTLADTVRRMLTHQRMAELAEAEGMDTFDDADDFDLEDDPIDPRTPYEDVFDPLTGASRYSMARKAAMQAEQERKDADAEYDAEVARSAERRDNAVGSGSGQSDPERESEPSPERKPKDKGSVRKRGQQPRAPEGEDPAD